MREINIAHSILNHRREKGLTQDALASYIGVSKASVSKWETGQSYPDITLLPLLASFFNITVDELIGYEPQMTREDIRQLYKRLSSDFAEKPFDEVAEQCREIVKKYFSCFPLLLQIGALLLNYSSLAGGSEKSAAILAEARELFLRVRKESGDVELSKVARNMEALCSLSLGEPDKALELLEGSEEELTSTESLLAMAYQMTGKNLEARRVLQAGIYKSLVALLGFLTAYLSLHSAEPAKHEEIYNRALAVSEAFNMETLHPSPLMSFYLAAAQGCMAFDTEKALDRLAKYAKLVTGDIYPLQLRGDDFFDLLDVWIDEALALGPAVPRDERTVRRSMLEAVERNPAFAPFEGNHRFRGIIEKLKANCKEE